MKTAIASTPASLNDLLNSDICEGEKIYCCFPFSGGEAEQNYIQWKIDKINIHSVLFSDNKEINKTTK
jgi:hypothetical protein